MLSFPKMNNLIGSVVNEILTDKKSKTCFFLQKDSDSDKIKDYLFNTHAPTCPRSFTIPSWAIVSPLSKKHD